MPIQFKTLTALSLAIALGACSSPQPKFYTLTAKAVPSSDWHTAPSMHINPISMPDSLDRAPIVIYKNDNQVELLEQYLWAAPLKAQLQSTLALNIARLSHNSQISTWPQLPAKNNQRTLSIQILRLEPRLNESLNIEMAWSFLDENYQTVNTQRTTVKEVVTGPHVDDLIAAYDRALKTLAEQIVQSTPE